MELEGETIGTATLIMIQNVIKESELNEIKESEDTTIKEGKQRELEVSGAETKKQIEATTLR